VPKMLPRALPAEEKEHLEKFCSAWKLRPADVELFVEQEPEERPDPSDFLKEHVKETFSVTSIELPHKGLRGSLSRFLSYTTGVSKAHRAAPGLQ